MAHSRLLQTLAAEVLALGAFASSCFAEGITVETVLTGLNAPTGVAVRPGPAGVHEVYVAEGGAGRIVRVRSDQPNASTEVIRGLPMSAPDKGAVEPLGLLFLDRERLVVFNRSAGGNANADATIARLYEVPADDKPLTADALKQQVDLPAESKSPVLDNRGHFALAHTRPNDHVPDMLLVISPNSGQSHALSRIPVRAGTFGELGTFPLAKERLPAGTPTAIAVSEQGYVVLSFTDGGPSRESHLAFVNPIDGSIAMALAIDLPGVIGLAYSTKSPALYAIAVAQTAGNEGGVYRIDASGQLGKPTARAVKLADLKRPTAIADGPDGTLYVTDLGESAGTSKTQGRLLKLTGEF